MQHAVDEERPRGRSGRRSAPVSVTSSPSVPAERASADAGARRAEGARVELVEATTDSDAISLVRTKRLEAKAQGRVLVVYVGASWCPPCRRFKAEVEQGRLDDRLGKTTLLVFDADRDVDRLGGAGHTFTFVPFVALPGPGGHPSDAQEARGKGDNAWTELLDKLDAWQAR